MKTLNVIYNHNIFDEPYKQSEVRKTEKKLKELFGEELKIVVSHSSTSSPNPFLGAADFILAEHTFTMAAEEKRRWLPF